MKTFLRFMATIIFISFFLVFGLFFALNNLGSLLAEDHSGLKWNWISAGVQIKTGGQVENIQCKFPVKVRLFNNRWVFQSGHYRVIFFMLPKTIPGFRIECQKVNAPSPRNSP